MSSIGKLHMTCINIYYTHPSRNKHPRLVILTEFFVSLCENFIDRHTAFCQVFDDCLCRHHKHSCRDSFPRNVSNQKSDRILVQLVKIVKVSANLFRRNHLSVYLELFVLMEVIRERRKLYLLSILQFPVNACGCLGNISLKCSYRRIDIIR